MSKDSSGGAARKRLADISNIPQRRKPLTVDDKSRLSSATVKEYIEQLQKENTSLMKLLTDRNKLIELSGSELQKLRINLQKMQQQNLQLAQSNSQMLAELNSGKDRLKALQHELGCKNGLLIAKKMELEGCTKTKTCKKIDSKENASKCEEARVCTIADKSNDKQCYTSRRHKSKSLCPSASKQVQDKDESDNKRLPGRRQSARFRHEEPKPTEDVFEIHHVELPPCPIPDDKMQEGGSDSLLLSLKKENGEGLCPSTSKQVRDKDEGDNKRLHARRQSARFRHEEPKPTEDLFEIDNVELPPCPIPDDKMQEGDSDSVLLSVKKEDGEANSLPDFKAAEHGRLSFSRPLRQAAKKVQSYKEVPLNVKMRRTETGFVHIQSSNPLGHISPAS